MATRIDPTGPAHMTSEERLTTIASVLAAGVIRMRQRDAITSDVDPDDQQPLRTAPEDCSILSPCYVVSGRALIARGVHTRPSFRTADMGRYRCCSSSANGMKPYLR